MHLNRHLIGVFAFSCALALPIGCADDEDSDDDMAGTSSASVPTPGGGGNNSGTEPGQSMGSVDNVAACQSFVDSLACGDADLSMYIDCSIYATTPCDIADYFTCAESEFTCTEGVPDVSGFVDCATMATCS